jgi:hypothetical protein
MLLVFRHLRVFTHAHPKVTFCEVERPVLGVAQSCDAHATLSPTARPHAQLGRRKRSSAPHSRDYSLSAPVNLQLLRCEHDETDRVAPSGALLWTRGWHPKPIMLHGARKPTPRQNSKRRAPASPSPRAQTGPLMRPHRATANRRRIHECNGLCACAYPPAGPNALEAEERWPPRHS